MPVTIALMSRKGGVGKTSLCIHLAGAMASEGIKVRLVDLDNQCSLTQFFLGQDRTETISPEATVDALVDGRRKAPDIEQETTIPNITLIPGHLKMAVEKGAEINLKTGEFTVQLLDTPPDLLNPIVRTALLNTDLVLSPVLPEVPGVQSIVSVQKTLHGVALASNPGLRLLGWVINMRQRHSTHVAMEEMLRRLHGPATLNTTIPKLAAFEEAYMHGQPITHFAPKSPAGKTITVLWEEIFARIKAIMAEMKAKQTKGAAA